MNKPYRVVEQICKCHYSIRCGEECIISSFDLRDERLANQICDELNKAHEKGKNEKEEEKS